MQLTKNFLRAFFLFSFLGGSLSLTTVLHVQAAPALVAPSSVQVPARAGSAHDPVIPGREPIPLSATPGQVMVPQLVTTENLILTPYFDCLVDNTGTMDINEAAKPENADKYQSFKQVSQLGNNGAYWLRFVLQQVEPNALRPAGTYLLDLGDSIPGHAVLYHSVTDMGVSEWKETQPGQRNILLLPEAGPQPTTCYLRLDGRPGIWFAPTMRTPNDAATTWTSFYKTAGMIAMFVVLILCLFRGLVEQGVWRFWAFLYLSSAIAQAWLGLPTTGAAMDLKTLAGLLTPGLALALFPLVGRGLMRCSDFSRSLSLQYLLLCIPGLAAIALPFLPPTRWLSQYAELWPLGLIILVPSTLGACLSGLPGSFRLLLGTLIPPACAAAGILGMKSGYPAHLLAALPVFGTAFSALLVMGLPQPSFAGMIPMNENKKEESIPPLTGGSNKEATSSLSAGDSLSLSMDASSSVSHPTNIVSPVHATMDIQSPSLDLPAMNQETLRPLPQIHESSSFTPSEDAAVFDLRRVLRDSLDRISEEADKHGIALSWYMPPSLPQTYSGSPKPLEQGLSQILHDAVSSEQCCSLRLSVKRHPEKGQDNKLIFTLTTQKDGSIFIPSSEALATARDLAAACQSYFSLDCIPGETNLSFTIKFCKMAGETGTKQEELHQKENTLEVLLLSDNPNIAVQIINALKGYPCRIRKAATLNDMLGLFSECPGHILIFQGRSATPQASELLQRIRVLVQQNRYPEPTILAYTPDESSWRALAKAGFTHALTLPVDKTSLINTLDETRQSLPSLEKKPQLSLTEVATSPSCPEPFQDNPGKLAQAAPEKQETAEVPDLFGTIPSTPSKAPNNSVSELNITMEHSFVAPTGAPLILPNKKEEAPKTTAGSTEELLARLASQFEKTLAKAREELAAGNLPAVAAASRAIAEAAHTGNMTALSKIATLVEQAANTEDATAVTELLPELANAVERKINELHTSL